MTDVAARHPALILFARYRAVLAAAWAARRELAGPSRLADEAAFLPAALSLQATPVHPAPRRAALAICLLFTCALLWAWWGELDIVATAPGRIVVSDGSKLVQPLEAGVVKAIDVRDGDHVRAGQLLVELDATGADADRDRVLKDRTAALSEALRASALLLALEAGKPPRLPAGNELQGAERSAAQAQLASEWSDITAQLAKLKAQADQHRAEAATVDQQIDKLQTTLPLARQREADFEKLATQGFVAGHASQDRARERIEMEKDLATQRARKAEALAAQFQTEQAYGAQRAETMRTLHERRSQADLKWHELDQEVTKAVDKSRLMRLTAPVDGHAQQLTVHTAGGVVTPAQVLMVVVPDRAEVTAQVTLENKDIGFVKAGQHAEIKLETFPYTRYGTVAAMVTSVAADAVMTANEAKPGNGNLDAVSPTGPATSAGFPALLTLAQRDIAVEGQHVALSPGMNVTAEIKTGKRRVLDYLLSPVKEHLGQSLGER